MELEDQNLKYLLGESGTITYLAAKLQRATASAVRCDDADDADEVLATGLMKAVRLSNMVAIALEKLAVDHGIKDVMNREAIEKLEIHDNFVELVATIDEQFESKIGCPLP